MTSSSVGFGILAEQRDGGEDLAGRAEAALERVVLDERGLHGVERVRSADAFDGRDRAVRRRPR